MIFNIDNLLEHIRVLAKQFPHRHAASVEQQGAARYIADCMRGSGLDVLEIETPIMGWEVKGSVLLEVLAPDVRRFECAPFMYSGSTAPEGLEGRLIRVGSSDAGGGEPWRKYAVVDDRDPNQWNALIVGRPDGPAMSRGANPGGSASSGDGPVWTRPSCVIGQNDSDLVESWLNEEVEVRVRYQVQTVHKVGSRSINVQGIVRGDVYPDEVVVIGVHHDSAGAAGYPDSVDSPGANDNASGVAILLELAAWYQKHGASRTLWFCSFDAEEYGLIGSSEFVRRACESGELDSVVAYIGIDQAAYGDVFWLLASSNERHLAPRVDMTAICQEVVDYLELGGRDDVQGPVPLHSQSDHWPFFFSGVPAILIGWHPFEGYHRGEDTYERCTEDQQFLQCANTADRLLVGVLALPELGTSSRPLSTVFVNHPPNTELDGELTWPLV